MSPPEARLFLGLVAVSVLLFSRGWGPYAPGPAPYRPGLRSLPVSAGFYGTAVLWLTGVWAVQAMKKPRAAFSGTDIPTPHDIPATPHGVPSPCGAPAVEA